MVLKRRDDDDDLMLGMRGGSKRGGGRRGGGGGAAAVATRQPLALPARGEVGGQAYCVREVPPSYISDICRVKVRVDGDAILGASDPGAIAAAVNALARVRDEAASAGGDPPALDPVVDLKLNSLGETFFLLGRISSSKIFLWQEEGRLLGWWWWQQRCLFSACQAPDQHRPLRPPSHPPKQQKSWWPACVSAADWLRRARRTPRTATRCCPRCWQRCAASACWPRAWRRSSAR